MSDENTKKKKKFKNPYKQICTTDKERIFIFLKLPVFQILNDWTNISVLFKANSIVADLKLF